MNTMSEQLEGVFNILATPFDKEYGVDIQSLKTLVEFQIDKGAGGLTILGVMGEAAKLTVEERSLVMETILSVTKNRLPVVVGTSHQDIQTCISLSKASFEAGANGVMIALPKMDEPTDDNIVAFYKTIAARIDGPIVVQDYPPVNDIYMSPDVLARIAEEIPNARYLKLEDPPLMQKITAIRGRTDKFSIFGGLGGMFFLEELQRGAAGTMTGFAFTEVLVAVYTAFRRGDQTAAELIFDRYLPLIRFENQPVINLTIRKELLFRRGAIACSTPRKPFALIDAGTSNEIERVLLRTGIEDPTAKITF